MRQTFSTGTPATDDDSPRRLAAAVLLHAVKDVRRRHDADALAWLASDCAQPWAAVSGRVWQNNRVVRSWRVSR